MKEYILICIIGICLLVLELLYFRIADHFNIVDKPNLRSSHKRIVLRGGGIIFLLGVWIYTAFYGLTYPYFLCGLTLIAGISFVDDIHSIPNSFRLLAHVVSIAFMFQEFGILWLDKWWIIISVFIFCVGVINAFNFMDGINGITSAFSLAVLFPLFYLNRIWNFVDNHLLIIVIVSVCIFSIFNFREKAKCFAGDVGAVGIAFILLFLIGKLVLYTNNPAYLLFFAVYGIDTGLTMIHRILLHENLGEAHRKHAYQLMANELKISHVLVSSFYMLLQLLISFGLIFLPINEWTYFFTVLVALIIGYILFVRKYYHLHDEYLKLKKIGL